MTERVISPAQMAEMGFLLIL